MRLGKLIFLSCAAILTPSSPGAGQNPAAPPASPLKVYARETIVDVTVTDAEGNAVHGLTRGDFTVKEDGKQQPLKSFQEFGAERPATQVAPRQLPPDVYTNAQPPAPTSGAVNVLMFDDLTTGLAKGLVAAPDQVQYEQSQALRYLNTMPAGTQVAIVELGNGLRVVQSFTSDRELLAAAVHALVYAPVQGAYRIPHPPTETIYEVCNVLNAQSELVVNGLGRAAAFLAGVKGRKNLIWFTPGTPWLTDYSRYNMIPCLQNFTPQLTGVYGLLTAEQVSLYPVDPRGVEDCANAMSLDTSKHATADMLGGLGCFNTLPDDHGSIDDMAGDGRPGVLQPQRRRWRGARGDRDGDGLLRALLSAAERPIRWEVSQDQCEGGPAGRSSGVSRGIYRARSDHSGRAGDACREEPRQRRAEDRGEGDAEAGRVRDGYGTWRGALDPVSLRCASDAGAATARREAGGFGKPCAEGQAAGAVRLRVHSAFRPDCACRGPEWNEQRLAGTGNRCV